MLLLEEAIDRAMSLGRAGDRRGMTSLICTLVSERVSVMHERAQVAEGRAQTLQRRLERLSLVAVLDMPRLEERNV